MAIRNITIKTGVRYEARKGEFGSFERVCLWLSYRMDNRAPGLAPYRSIWAALTAN
jgi:hypothetical protein